MKKIICASLALAFSLPAFAIPMYDFLAPFAISSNGISPSYHNLRNNRQVQWQTGAGISAFVSSGYFTKMYARNVAIDNVAISDGIGRSPAESSIGYTGIGDKPSFFAINTSIVTGQPDIRKLKDKRLNIKLINEDPCGDNQWLDEYTKKDSKLYQIEMENKLPIWLLQTVYHLGAYSATTFYFTNESSERYFLCNFLVDDVDLLRENL